MARAGGRVEGGVWVMVTVDGSEAAEGSAGCASMAGVAGMVGIGCLCAVCARFLRFRSLLTAACLEATRCDFLGIYYPCQIFSGLILCQFPRPGKGYYLALGCALS